MLVLQIQWIYYVNYLNRHISIQNKVFLIILSIFLFNFMMSLISTINNSTLNMYLPKYIIKLEL